MCVCGCVCVCVCVEGLTSYMFVDDYFLNHVGEFSSPAVIGCA